MLATLVFSVLIGAQFLAVFGARRVHRGMHRAEDPDAARLRHIWFFG